LPQNQSAARELGGDAAEAVRPDVIRIVPKSDAGLDGLRAEVQRKLAAQIDLGTPDPAPLPQAERVTPRADRPRMDNLRAEAKRNVTITAERKSLGSLLPTGRWRMRPSRILLLFIALGAGGLAAFLVTQREAPAPAVAAAAPATQIVAAPTTQVLVAKTAIAVGDRLSATSLQWASWPQDSVNPQFITVTADPQAMTEMAGAVARSDFIVGEPIRKEKLASSSQGFLSTVLGSGMRGVSVSVSAESASGGFISPNDRVDVVVTRNADGHSSSDVILRNVRVLAINDHLGPPVGGTDSAAPAATAANARSFDATAVATLELDTAAAQLLISAGATGKLSLMLRSADDGTMTADNSDLAANAAIRLNSPFWTTGTQAVPSSGGTPVAPAVR
jgi:pilus assembly protein CpaB